MSSYSGALRHLAKTRLTLKPHTRLPVSSRRTFRSSSRVLARKDAQDKDDLKPESNEYSKTGSDQESAAMDDAAFNPQKTSPEEEYDTAGRESDAKHESNPLDGSPANQELSGWQNPRGGEGSPATSGSGEEERARTSGGGSAPKSGGGQHGGGGGN